MVMMMMMTYGLCSSLKCLLTIGSFYLDRSEQEVKRWNLEASSGVVELPPPYMEYNKLDIKMIMMVMMMMMMMRMMMMMTHSLCSSLKCLQIIDSFYLDRSEQEVKRLRRLVEVATTEGLLASIKVYCDWMRVNPHIVATCAKVCEILRCFLNFKTSISINLFSQLASCSNMGVDLFQNGYRKCGSKIIVIFSEWWKLVRSSEHQSMVEFQQPIEELCWITIFLFKNLSTSSFFVNVHFWKYSAGIW